MPCAVPGWGEETNRPQRPQHSSQQGCWGHPNPVVLGGQSRAGLCCSPDNAVTAQKAGSARQSRARRPKGEGDTSRRCPPAAQSSARWGGSGRQQRSVPHHSLGYQAEYGEHKAEEKEIQTEGWPGWRGCWGLFSSTALGGGMLCVGSRLRAVALGAESSPASDPQLPVPAAPQSASRAGLTLCPLPCFPPSGSAGTTER